MGTWSVDSFGNDDACDWTYELAKANDLTPVEEAIDAVLNSGEDGVEAYEATEAIAAIEVIARLQGNWGDRSAYSERLDDWVEKNNLQPSVALKQKANLAIERILAEDSELNELWQESEEYEAWRASVTELMGRVNLS
ncbi:MAG: hypothetical protein DCF19_16215 [Pseudanabaena frigida]|uniref:DUF4259 domain-containing protein n=1 Tax=Pseudanabaena frigida TaxID=945775 RepID=A0A2W4Y588_9CYAN|nr:MAG: hypothetical protein DCF19_16215 [Pseudanabaena frigida]